MSSLTKKFFKGQIAHDKRQLETLYALLSLNDTQKQRLREVTDNLIKNVRDEMTAPADKVIKETTNV